MKTHAEINAALDAKMAALGIETTGKPVVEPLPTVTVYPGERTTERLAHFGADRLIANNAAYDKVCEQTDVMLAGLLEGVSTELTPPRRSKSTRAPRVRHVMVND